jgi:molybdopterin/thiamine biosynthesis adenylyltransferase
MSQRLINRSPDLKRLQNEGYNIEIQAGYLIVKDVPYVNEKLDVKHDGVLVSVLTLNDDSTQRPADHIVSFAGDFPCNKDGSKITGIEHTNNRQEIATDIVTNYTFSNKPPSGYPDYYAKMTRYVDILWHQALAIDTNATPKTFPVIKDNSEESVFHYVDTASSRAGITVATAQLSNQVVAIVGLGGTGAYVLDLLAKTPVREIHLYDDDIFIQHNAFRAPGAASIDDFKLHPKKVDYYAQIYSRMRKDIIPHPYHLTESKINEIKTVGTVFLCLDTGPTKKDIVKQLQTLNIQFIDCGIDVLFGEGRKLTGQIRVTTCTTDKKDHVQKYISFADTDDGDNEYSKNIQVADLNALTASLAVIKWKKLCGFYADLEKEHQMAYDIDGNIVNNGEYS